MAEINGGKFGDGLTTAAINKIIIENIGTKNSGLSTEEARWLSVALGLAFGDYQSAAINDIATENNYLTRDQYLMLQTELEIFKDDSAAQERTMEYWQIVHDVQLLSCIYNNLYGVGYSEKYALELKFGDLMFETGGVDLNGNPVVLVRSEHIGSTTRYEQQEWLDKVKGINDDLSIPMRSLNISKNVVERKGISSSDPRYISEIAQEYKTTIDQYRNLGGLNVTNPKDVTRFILEKLYTNYNKDYHS